MLDSLKHNSFPSLVQIQPFQELIPLEVQKDIFTFACSDAHFCDQTVRSLSSVSKETRALMSRVLDDFTKQLNNQSDLLKCKIVELKQEIDHVVEYFEKKIQLIDLVPNEQEQHWCFVLYQAETQINSLKTIDQYLADQDKRYEKGIEKKEGDNSDLFIRSYSVYRAACYRVNQLGKKLGEITVIYNSIVGFQSEG